VIAFWVPAETPREIVGRMNGETGAALADLAIKWKLEQLGYIVARTTPEDVTTPSQIRHGKMRGLRGKPKNGPIGGPPSRRSRCALAQEEPKALISAYYSSMLF